MADEEWLLQIVFCPLPMCYGMNMLIHTYIQIQSKNNLENMISLKYKCWKNIFNSHKTNEFKFTSEISLPTNTKNSSIHFKGSSNHFFWQLFLISITFIFSWQIFEICIPSMFIHFCALFVVFNKAPKDNSNFYIEH